MRKARHSSSTDTSNRVRIGRLELEISKSQLTMVMSKEDVGNSSRGISLNNRVKKVRRVDHGIAPVVSSGNVTDNPYSLSGVFSGL